VNWTLFYLLLFTLAFIFTLASNILFIIKSDNVAKKFKSKLIKDWHEKMRNTSLALLIIKISINSFILLILFKMVFNLSVRFTTAVFDLDILLLLIGLVLLTWTGASTISKTAEISDEYGFNK